MQPTRLERLRSVILEEMSLLISRELKDPRIPPLTITRVDLTPDAGVATLYVTILGMAVSEPTPEFEAEIKDALEGLKSASGFLRRALAKVLNIRHVPELQFKHDRGLANTLRVHELLKQIGDLPKEPQEDS